jgi:hypothetical protein
MSYSLIPYLIHLPALKLIPGSTDDALIASVIASRPEEFEDGGEDEGEISLRAALTDLVMGKTLDPKSAHQYGYALEKLCDHIGERLDSDCWESIRWSLIEATGMERLLRTGPPVQIPAIDSFPAIGHLDASEITQILDDLGDGHLKSAVPYAPKYKPTISSRILSFLLSRLSGRPPLTDEDLAEPLEEYEGWLREAAAKQKSLVFFYY